MSSLSTRISGTQVSGMQVSGMQVILVLAFAGLVTSGCRSYGGHGAEEATYRQMQVAHQVFEEELVRARADLDRVQSAASNNAVLNHLAIQYAEIVQGHEAILEHHENWIADLSADSDYRPLHRTYGAIISQQRTIRTQYEGVLDHVQRIAGQQDTTQHVQRPYSMIPPYYNRVSGQQRDLSVSRVLSAVRSGGGPAAGAQITTPANDAGAQLTTPADDADARAGDAETDPDASTGDPGIDGANQ